jgi:hypothetical protein
MMRFQLLQKPDPLELDAQVEVRDGSTTRIGIGNKICCDGRVAPI